jgi:GNAT superfamily N-acetyltransferase
MDDVVLRPMIRGELDLAVGWAAREGWNPGPHDADVFWATDPQGFVALERDGEVIGTGAIVSYDGRFGFMGFFIVRPDCRGLGLGRDFWHQRVRRLAARLRPGASIGLDGVFAMQAFYAKGGFQLFGRDLRFEGRGEAAPVPPGVVPAARVDPAEILALDAEHFPAPRPRFLERWLHLPESAALASVRAGRLVGYAVARRCLSGVKIGPLFARDPAAAADLFQACSAHAAGQPLFLDVPEGNPAALELARRHGMREVFGCARMYLGPVPRVNHAGVYGVTTFELG